MRILTIVLTVISLALIVFNLSKVDWSSPLEGQSMVAIITTVALACAILLLQILRTSKKIESKVKKGS